MTVETRTMTAEELLRMPDDGSRYELVRGELRKMSPAGEQHSRTALRIGARLLLHVEPSRLGAVYGADGGFILAEDPETVRSPDVAFVRSERVVKTAKYVRGAPDLAVEVLAPSDTYSEVAEKTREYLQAGTRAVVVIDPEKKTADVHRLVRNECVSTRLSGSLEVDDVVPGWKMPLAEIFD